MNKTQVFQNIIATIPKEYRYFLKYKLIVLPINQFYKDYYLDKQNLIDTIIKSQNLQINSMHKYSYDNPLPLEQIHSLNNTLFPFIREFYEMYNHLHTNYYSGFSIYYDKFHNKKLDIHTDDSLYTMNLCLKNTAEDNEIVFDLGNKYITMPIKEDYMLIHLGNTPHFTNEISTGERINIIMWFKN